MTSWFQWTQSHPPWQFGFVWLPILWTIGCIALIVGWQTLVFLRNGSWQALPLSLVLNTTNDSDSEIYLTASVNGISESRAADFLDALLQVPIITLLFLAAAVPTAYSWLYKIEKRLVKIQLRWAWRIHMPRDMSKPPWAQDRRRSSPPAISDQGTTWRGEPARVDQLCGLFHSSCQRGEKCVR